MPSQFFHYVGYTNHQIHQSTNPPRGIEHDLGLAFDMTCQPLCFQGLLKRLLADDASSSRDEFVVENGRHPHNELFLVSGDVPSIASHGNTGSASTGSLVCAQECAGVPAQPKRHPHHPLLSFRILGWPIVIIGIAVKAIIVPQTHKNRSEVIQFLNNISSPP